MGGGWWQKVLVDEGKLEAIDVGSGLDRVLLGVA